MRLHASQDATKALQAAFDGFKAQVAAEGKIAQQKADAQAAKDKLSKENADAEHAKSVAALKYDIARLRKQRSNPDFSGLSAPAPTAASPDRTCFDPAKLAGTLRSLDEGLLGIVEIGSKAVIDLDVAKAWARSQQQSPAPSSP